MIIQLTLQELMIFLVCSLGIAAGILLIPILWNIKKMVVILRLLVETNQESVQKSFIKMPGIFENIGQISSNVRETTDKLNIAVPVIIQEVESVTNAAKGSLELAGVVMANVGSGINETIATYQRDTVDFIAYFHIFEEVLQMIYRTFSSSK
jgi:hypothetical protein